MNNLPVSYYWSKKAWITQDIFRHWIKILDNKFWIQKRQVLMLLDNASSHIEPKKNKENNNEVIKIIFFIIHIIFQNGFVIIFNLI